MSSAECRQIEPELSAFLDGELNAERAAAVQRHVAGCATCARETSALRAVSSAIGELPRASAPLGLSTAVMSEARRRALLSGRDPGRRRTLYFALRVGASAAMLTLVVFASWRMMTPPVNERAPGSAAAPSRLGGAPVGGAAGADERAAVAKKALESGPGNASEAVLAAGRVETPASSGAAPVSAPAAPEWDASATGAPIVGTPIAMKDARADAAETARGAGVDDAVRHAGSAAPPIDVVVNTVDMVQYSNALRVLAAVSDHDAEAIQPEDARNDDAERSKSPAFGGGAVAAKSEPAVLRQIMLRGDARRVQSTIDRLEAEAPRQVDVTVNMRWADREQIGALLNTRAPADAMFAAGAPATAPAVAEGLNRVRREPPSLGFNTATPIDQAPQRRATAGGRAGDNTGRGIARVPATSQPGSVARDESGRETTRKEAPRTGATVESDLDRREYGLAGGTAPRGNRSDSQPLAVAVMEATGEWLRALGSQVANAVGIGGSEHAARPDGFEPETVMFRVTIVPPPPVGATQPSR